jgi:hypothetical protein
MGALLSVQVADEAQAVVAALHAALLLTAASHASAAGPRRRPGSDRPAFFAGPLPVCTMHTASAALWAHTSIHVHRMAHTSRVIPPAQLILQISHISLERRRPAAFAAAARHTAALCEHQRSSTAAPRLAARATALLPSRSRAPSARTPDHLLPPPTRPRGPTRPQVPQHHAAHVSDVAANERREGRRHGLRRRR